MQGVAAHDLIEHEDQYMPHSEPRAVLGSSPPPRLAARPIKPEQHGPSVTERELGEALHPDRNAALGHPGVSCSDLPAGHAHRLPRCGDARDLQNPGEAEAPLLVTAEERRGQQEDEEEPREQ